MTTCSTVSRLRFRRSRTCRTMSRVAALTATDRWAGGLGGAGRGRPGEALSGGGDGRRARRRSRLGEGRQQGGGCGRVWRLALGFGVDLPLEAGPLGRDEALDGVGAQE